MIYMQRLERLVFITLKLYGDFLKKRLGQSKLAF
jgi:hypothetical protein